MTKKICMIVQEHYPKDIRVMKEARALLVRGHKVSIIAVRAAHESKQEIIDGVNVYRLGLEKRRGGVFRYFFEYLVFFVCAGIKLNRLDLKDRFDIVHVNTLPDFLVFSTVVQKLRGRRILLDMHEIMPEFFMSKFKVGSGHPVVRLLRVLERSSLKFADDIITVNEPIKQIFQNRAVLNKPITVVMNTVSASTIQNSVKRPHNGFNCVYHGTVTDIYGLNTAIEAFSEIHRKHKEIVFHIFGDGPSLPELRRLAQDLNLQEGIVFHGAVSYEKMMNALSDMDLGILAVRKDVFLNLSFSNKLAEYVYLKIPVISSDLDTVKYYFDDEDLLFFKAGDTRDLSSKIEFAYLHRDQMQTKAETAYKTFQAFDWDTMAKRYVELLEKDAICGKII